MELNFKDALELAKGNEDIERSMDEGYYLNSAVGIVNFPSREAKRWIITFYNPDKEEVVQGIVKGEGSEEKGEVNFKESEEAMDPSENKIDPENIELPVKEALDTALDEVDNLAQGISQILINLRNMEKEVFEISMITKSLSLYKVDVDADTGEVIDTEMKTLMKEGSESMPF